MNNFKDKVVLITGGSSGMGAATAKLLADKGARIFCAQRTNSIHEDILVDLNDIDAPSKIISEIKNKTNRLDILINNAGIMKENTVEEISLKEWNEHLTINLTIPFLSFNIPNIAFIAVDLPAPLGPITTTISPFSTLRVQFLIISTPPYPAVIFDPEK